MAESYCGKTCKECAEIELVGCPGCRVGPGKLYGGDCKLAKCVRDKGHETCDTCGFKPTCGTYAIRFHMPDARRRESEAEEMRKIAITKRASILGKWLWIIFWLIIPSTIGSFMANENTAELLPGLFIPGTVINIACSLTYGAILLKLSSEEAYYRTAGGCSLFASSVSGVVKLIFGSSGASWTLLITLPAAVVAMVGEYYEYMGHSSVLSDVDYELSEKWQVLWKWYIGTYLGLFGSIIASVIIPVLGVLVLMGASIGILVVSILKLVYLYRTAKIFREYSIT